MLKGLVTSALRLRYLVIAGAVALVLAGLRTAESIPVDVFPEFAPPIIEVQTEAPGLSTEEVDALVTVPLESALNGSPWIRTIRSKSVLGLSSVVMILEEGADLVRARQLVQERLTVAARELPAVIKPPVMLSPLSALSRAMKIGVSSRTASMLELSETVRWTIRPRLLSVPGVANVAVWGGRQRQLQVVVDPRELDLRGLTLGQVEEAARRATTIGAGGFIDSANQRLPLAVESLVHGAEDLGAGVVQRRADGSVLRLGDVAEIREGHAPLIGEGLVNDAPGILLIVEKHPWANTVDVTKRVEAVVDALRPALPGVAVDTTIFRPATFVERSIGNLEEALRIGILLVALVLCAFLFDWRTALVSMTALPVSLLAAILVLERMGGTINTMILAGLVIALGEVVDDAIIDVENIARRIREARASGRPFNPFQVVLAASLEVRSAVVHGSLIVVLVMLPIFALEGLTGAFFRPLAMSYVIAIGASLVTALLLTPALSLLLVARRTGRSRTPPLVRGSIAIYKVLLSPLLRFPILAPALMIVAILAAGFILPRLGEDFLPRFKETDFLMHWLLKPGASVEASTRISVKAAKDLMAIEGVRNLGAHIGRAEVADEVVGPNFTELWISIDPERDYDATVAKVQQTVDAYPGLIRDLLTYLKERIKEVLTGASGSIVVRTFGPDLGTLQEQAGAIRDELASIEGIGDLKVEPLTMVPQVKLRMHADALARYGMDAGSLRAQIETLVRGKTVGVVFDEQKTYDVTVWGSESSRGDPAALRDWRVEAPGGQRIPLGELADLRIEATPNTIKREGASRRIDVTINPRGRDLGSVAREVEARMASHDFPAGYHAEVLGEYAARREASRRLATVAILAVLGVFIVLFSDFRSIKAALIVFTGLPAALAGGVFAVLFTGGVLSLGSLIGFVTVLGIAARNSIMLIDHYRRLETEEGLTFGPELIRRGAEERVAPILMTALTTALALVPILGTGDRPGHEIEQPMAVVITGGLLTSTLLSLFVLPPLWLLFGRGAARVADE